MQASSPFLKNLNTFQSDEAASRAVSLSLRASKSLADLAGLRFQCSLIFFCIFSQSFVFLKQGLYFYSIFLLKIQEIFVFFFSNFSFCKKICSKTASQLGHQNQENSKKLSKLTVPQLPRCCYLCVFVDNFFTFFYIKNNKKYIYLFF